MMHKGGLNCKIRSMWKDAVLWDLGGTIPKITHL